MRTKCSVRSKFLGVARQLIDLVELLVPAHEVQADLDGLSLIITLDGSNTSVKPAAGLAAARVDLGAFHYCGIGQ